ncbi:nucleocapsid [Sanxia Water Strider Virus 5]|uniref:nucleocapsid n=1 Tax=Sanxia Water Strider Virus 5 TaxID=1608064 RepID=UPI0005AD4F08|nr:nucleocapsid [Sanxia Water Strider Virus 5]AJG39116.1 nucleocapsid [Sanxia Water Strider Virus 5]
MTSSIEEIWKVEGLEKVSAVTVGVTRVAWSDQYFLSTYFKTIRARSSATAARTACRVFLRWYVGGCLPENVKLIDLYLSIISKMSYGENHSLFPDSGFNGATSVPIGNLGTPGTQDLEYKNNHVTTLELTSSSTGAPLLWNDTSVKEWHNRLLEYDISNSPDEFSESQRNFVNICGFLALTMLRGIAKDADMITRSMAKTVAANINNLWNLTLSECPPPNMQSIAYMMTVMKKGSPNANLILGQILNSYMDQSTNPTVVGIFRASCLMSLGMNGMNSLHWLMSAARVNNIQPIVIARCLATNSHSKTNTAIVDLMKNQMLAGQTTWEWSRLFNEGAFMDLSVREDPLYAGTCFFLSEGHDAQPSNYLSLASYLKGPILDSAKIKALKIAAYLREQDLSTAQTTEASAVANVIIQTPTRLDVHHTAIPSLNQGAGDMDEF